MKMSQRVALCSVALFLALTSVSAVQRLNSINDLKKINFGQSVPKHSLLLLHWFANKVSIVNNNVIWLNFDPNNEDYGSHYYGNFDGVLGPLPQGHRYYTVGNIYQDNSVELPSYVVNHGMEDIGENMARIIIRMSDSFPNIADQVYITQHYEADQHQGTEYDRDHTYKVTTDLLREIREFSVTQNQRHSLSELRDDFGSNATDRDLWGIRNTWGELASLGLLLFIVIQERRSNTQSRAQRAARRKIHFVPQNVFSVDNTENRQNVGDANDFSTCICVSLIFLIILLFILFISFLFYLR